MTKKRNPKEAPSTYDEFVKSLGPKKKKQFDDEYKELVLSELLIAVMREDDISVRKLAKEAGISPTIIQDMRSGKKQNLTLQTFLKILNALNCSLVIEKELKKKSEVSRFVFSGPELSFLHQ